MAGRRDPWSFSGWWPWHRSGTIPEARKNEHFEGRQASIRTHKKILFSAFPLPVALAALFTVSCSFPTFTRPHPNQPGRLDALLDNRSGCPFCVRMIWKSDGTTLYDRQTDGLFEAFRLAPDTYEIWYGYQYRSLPFVSGRDKVQLQAGREYKVVGEARYFTHYGSKIWIEEATSGRVVAGKRW